MMRVGLWQAAPLLHPLSMQHACCTR